MRDMLVMLTSISWALWHLRRSKRQRCNQYRISLKPRLTLSTITWSWRDCMSENV